MFQIPPNISTVFIQIDAHALIDAYPVIIKFLGNKNRWNRWFLHQKCIDFRLDFGPIMMHQLHVLLTLNALLLGGIRYHGIWD